VAMEIIKQVVKEKEDIYSMGVMETVLENIEITN
jgi:folylpolyglutamate synthase/dihydropteroate synthase